MDDTIHVLFESTAISSGYSVRNPAKFAQKMQKVIYKSLGVDHAEKPDDSDGYSAPLEPEMDVNAPPPLEEETHDEL